MNITIYTKTACPNCVSAKELLKTKGLTYEEWSMDDDYVASTFATLHPGIRQMPQIFIDGQRVGGFAGLQAALRQLGL